MRRKTKQNATKIKPLRANRSTAHQDDRHYVPVIFLQPVVGRFIAEENEGPMTLPRPLLHRGPTGAKAGAVGLAYGVLGPEPAVWIPNSLCTI